MIPQLVILTFIFLAVGIHLGKHNEPRTGHYNFWWALGGSIAEIYILWAGGFFVPLGF